MIRLNIWNMYPMINPRKQHKAALDGGGEAQAGLEWMNHLEFVTGLKMISTESNQGWAKQLGWAILTKNWPLLRDDWVTADHFV